ncbi:MAG TPA: hypothetical protein VGE74_32135, partial [Gemmata sp.]
MTESLGFVSFDIVSHSAEPDIGVQLERVRALNRFVRDALERLGPDRAIWASGGDGGHVAL